ncbi:unnamed protein product [Macrosiphum euphorbiae]|uniref:Zinc finger BED domain-containing protein RICESLEEPER 1-like n=1 Tax=Macrosiphum euphorbiae TaxID=13131 RepID=A0AAV0Y1C5_9HEMI|nr:unnamed protein product [Macrosiphum euphorbiae]
MVTVNGRPFSILHDSGFRKLLNPIIEGLPETGFAINSHNIKCHIIDKTQLIINNITTDIANRLISLKVDCVTRHNRSLIGINIQYMQHNVLQLKTLAITELMERHSAIYLKEMVSNVLDKYGIAKRQIFSITSDNAANILKMTDIIDDPENDSTENDDNFIMAPTNEIEEFESNVVQAIEPEPLTKKVRCSAHTLNLCIEDGLKIRSLLNVIGRIRTVVKKIRTQKYTCILKNLA